MPDYLFESLRHDLDMPIAERVDKDNPGHRRPQVCPEQNGRADVPLEPKIEKLGPERNDIPRPMMPGRRHVSRSDARHRSQPSQT